VSAPTHFYPLCCGRWGQREDISPSPSTPAGCTFAAPSPPIPTKCVRGGLEVGKGGDHKAQER
jgi:hypothetical protein